MLDSVEQSMPTAGARRRIWIARKHLDYAEAQGVTGDLMPIYAALEEVESLVPADSIRGHLDRAEQRLEREDREGARRELIRADQELLFVEADLPLRSTRRHLAEAREALEMGQSDRAGASLRQAEDALMLLTGIVQSPLAAARWSLAKAVAEYKKGGSEEAERYVTIARQSLERISDNQSEANRTTLKALVAELRSLEGRIATQSADALEKLEQQADRVQELTFRS
jgi:hypothetical protein